MKVKAKNLFTPLLIRILKGFIGMVYFQLNESKITFQYRSLAGFYFSYNVANMIHQSYNFFSLMLIIIKFTNNYFSITLLVYEDQMDNIYSTF